MSSLAARFALLGLALFLALGAHGAALGTQTSEAERARQTLLSERHVFTDGASSLSIAPRQLARLVHLHDHRLVADRAGFRRLLAPRFPDQAARDARLEISGRKAEVVAGFSARRLDVARTVAALLREPARTTNRVFFRLSPPAVTTAELQRLRIRTVVSEFTTYYPAGQPRVLNIQRAAQLLDGRIIAAGATFSMNAALGERTLARGFVAAPSIAGGRYVDSIGGGISQVATTLYNAAFFAGLDLVAHTPHSFYIDRYPIGREATISWGGPELIFKNDWSAAILMKVEATDTSVTVRFYSSPLGRRVETTTGPPRAWVAATTREVVDGSLAPGERIAVQEPGDSGFTVDYTRRVYREGNLIRNERFETRYEPVNGIVLVAPPPDLPH